MCSSFPGATAREVERLVSSPAEQMLSEIEGVEHVYSVSRPGMAVLTVQFLVGQPRTDAIVRLYNKLYSNLDWLPTNRGWPAHRQAQGHRRRADRRADAVDRRPAA